MPSNNHSSNANADEIRRLQHALTLEQSNSEVFRRQVMNELDEMRDQNRVLQQQVSGLSSLAATALQQQPVVAPPQDQLLQEAIVRIRNVL